MDEDVANILGVEYQECSKFHRFLRMVCAATLDDLEKNEGARFRQLIKNTDFLILSQIVGNEKLRDWMASRPSGVTVYHLEDAVVEAAILLITSVISQAADEVESYAAEIN